MPVPTNEEIDQAIPADGQPNRALANAVLKGLAEAVTESSGGLDASAVRAVPLTGLSTADASNVLAADSILVGFGKLQAQSSGKAPASHTHTASQVTDFSAAADARADARISAQKGVAGGLAPLDVSSKVDPAYLPDNVSTPTAVAYSSAIPLNGNKYMTNPPHVLVAATNFSLSGSAVLGGQCTVKLASNGVVVPTFSGFVEHGSSAGWSSVEGAINNVIFFSDGWTNYYSVSQNVGDPTGISVPTTATKSGITAPGQVDITLSEAIDTGVVPETSKFTVTTANGGAQTDTVTGVSLPGPNTVRLATSRAATPGDVTSVTYDPTQGASGQRLVDLSGNILFAWNNLAAVVQSFVGSLDTRTAGLAGAWSLRRLLSSYTGPAVRVNNGTIDYDVPFNLYGDLDLSGVPGGTLTVVRFFNQLGNGVNNAADFLAHPVNGAPRLVLTGGPSVSRVARLQALTGRAFRLTSSSGGLGAAGLNLLGAAGEMTLMSVSKYAASQVFTAVYGMAQSGNNTSFISADIRTDGIGTNNQLRFFNAATQFAVGENNQVFDGITSWHQHTLRKTAAKVLRVRGYTASGGLRDGGDTTDGSAGPTPASQTTFGVFDAGGSNGQNASDGDTCEVVLYRTGLSDVNRDAIEVDQRSYWGI